MNTKLFYSLLLFLFLRSACPTKAQDNDFGAWVGVDLQKDIRNWTFSVGEELRTMNNAGTIRGSYTSLGVDYAPLKRLKFGTSYQFILFNDTDLDDIQPRHRLNLYTTGNFKLGNFKFNLRERFQMTFKDESERNYKMNPKNVWRNRLEVEYNIPDSKLTPSFSVETYYQLNNPDGNKFEQIRYKLAASYKLNKHNKLELFGLFDHEINVKNPVDQTVLGLTYTHQLRNKKKNKND